MKTISSSRLKINKPLITALIAAIILIGLVYAYSHRHNAANKSGVTPVPSASASPTLTPVSHGPSTDTYATAKPAVTSMSAPNATAIVSTVPAPTGDFLSSSTISLSSSSTTESSTCQTIPGASCAVVIQNSATAEIARINVPSTDNSGGHSVYWDVKKYITSPGTYDVFGVATSGSNSSKSQVYKLGVQQ